jgi:energy-coupling factor transporter ATP-binding protein EcfA2
MNKNLILIRGVSGSGKSTVSNLFRGVFSISTDDMFMVDGKYKFDPSKLGEYHQATIGKVEEQMLHTKTAEDWEASYNTIVVHNTFTEVWEMDPYYALADKYIWTVHSIIVENRHFGKSIHDVPDNVLKSQKSRFNIAL